MGGSMKRHEAYRILGVDRWTVKDTGAVVSLPLIPSLYKHQSREHAQEPPKWTGRPPAAIADAPPMMRLNNIPARVRPAAPPRAPIVVLAPPAPDTPLDVSPAPPPADDSLDADMADYADDPWTVGRLASLAEYTSTKLRVLKLAARVACDVRAADQMRANTVPAPFCRHLVYWALARVCGYSTSRIGRVLDRDHSTVLAGLRKMDADVRAGAISFDASTDILELFRSMFAVRNGAG